MKYYEVLAENKLAIGWLDTTSRIKDDMVRSISTNLTSYWAAESGIFFNIQNLCHADIDSLLREAADRDIDWLLVCAPGLTLVRDGNFLSILSKMISSFDHVAVMGHVLDRGDRYYMLHHQTILVNLRWYRTQGMPLFGQEETCQWSTTMPLRSDENFHDGYTPTWVRKGTESRDYLGRYFGWNLIRSALDSGFEVRPFPPELRKSKHYHYPEVDSDWPTKMGSVWYDLQTDVHFVTNTESVVSVPAKHHGTFDVCMTPAGGYNTILIPWFLGLRPYSRVIVNDISGNALSMSRNLKMHYRGQPAKDFFKTHMLYQEDDPNHRKVYRAIDDDNFAWMQSVLDTEMSKGLMDYITDVIPTLQYEWRCVNIFDENDWWAFTSGLSENDKVYVNLSNIFHYLPTCLFYSLKNRIKIHDRLMARLESAPSTYYMHYVHPNLRNMYYANPQECRDTNISDKMKVLPWNR